MKKMRAAALLASILVLAGGLFSCSREDGGKNDAPADKFVFNEDGTVTINAYSAYNLDDYVVLGTYKGVTVERADPTPTQEDIDAYVYSLRSSKATEKAVTDRPVQTGDTVSISYDGTMDNMETPSGLSTGGQTVQLTIGSGSYIDGFESGLIGANAGDTVELHLTFPDPYKNNPDLAGQPVTFKVIITAISEKVLPDYDDYFVASVSDYTTVKEYEAALALQLYSEKYNQIKSQQISSIWNTVAATSSITQYPETELKEYEDEMIASYTEYASANGYADLETMLSELYNVSLETFQSDVEKYAQETISQELILFDIIRREGITLSVEEYNTGAAEYAASYNLDSVEALEAQYSRDVVAHSLLWDKTMEYLLENAELVEPGTLSVK